MTDERNRDADPPASRLRTIGLKVLQGVAFLPLSAVPMLLLIGLFGPNGGWIGAAVAILVFVKGYRSELLVAGKPSSRPVASQALGTALNAGRNASSSAASTADVSQLRPTAAAPTSAARSPQPKRGLWWKIPVGATALIWVIGTLLGPPPSRTAKEGEAGTKTGALATSTAPASADVTAQTATGSPDTTPESKFRTFKQRPCSGFADCLEANIAAEQTQASRDFNRMARDQIGDAVTKLGPPTFVLRSGDVVGIEGYRQNGTEMKLAGAIVGWANEVCHPNELHVVTNGGQTAVSPEPGGSSCTRDGSAYPLPPARFLCNGGRKSDALCKLTGVLRLPGVAPQGVPAAGASTVDQAVALSKSPEHHGFVTAYVMSGVSTCNGMYLGDVPTGGATAERWMAGRRRGETAGKAAMAKDQKLYCDELVEKYGPAGSAMPGMFKKLGP